MTRNSTGVPVFLPVIGSVVPQPNSVRLTAAIRDLPIRSLLDRSRLESSIMAIFEYRCTPQGG